MSNVICWLMASAVTLLGIAFGVQFDSVVAGLITTAGFQFALAIFMSSKNENTR